MAGVDKTRAWLVVAMLFLFMLINFADKAVLGLSAVPIMKELGLNHETFGWVGTSFFLFFSGGAVLIGFVVNRIHTKWVLLAMALIWALCQLPMLLSVGLGMLFANRIVLGLGEGPAYPVALHSTYKWFPNERRPFPTSFIAIGGAVGTGIVAPAIVYVIRTYSWHSAFGLLGIVGLLWCLVWLAVGREGPLAADEAYEARAGEVRIPYLDLLTCRTVVGAVILGFVAYWLLTLAVVWLPAYLEKGAGFSPYAVGWILTAPPLVQIVLGPAICGGSQRLKLTGVSSRIARGWVAAGCVMIAGLATIALSQSSGTVLPILFTAIAFSIGTVIFVLGHVMVAEVSPVRQRGAMLGINNAIATLAGPFAPVIMGKIVDVGANAAEGFRAGFVMAGVLVVVGALLGFLLIDPERDIRRLARRGGAAAVPARLRPAVGD
jgi:MFS family permease